MAAHPAATPQARRQRQIYRAFAVEEVELLSRSLIIGAGAAIP